ncbi:pilus assembly protein TadG-related protein [Massilia sp. CCM 8734]|uniref:pilus assembly protein TadG-related protein n=1 Tax=Massilia sp. CCM 8734 TaxID=2609283 RepID=UPI00142115D0
MRKIRNYQNGQALVLFLAFAAALTGIMLVAFNSGQVTNAKMRAMNAADAAAYSGAVWQARTLNFQAYMNRAMIVNEVTIAQSVSLRSWIDYLAELVRNVGHIAKFYPPVYAAVQKVSVVLDKVNNEIQRQLPQVEDALRALNTIEHTAQIVFNNSGSVIAADIAYEVTKRNGAEISRGGAALFAYNVKEWSEFTETYNKTNRPSIGKNSDGRARLREVVLNSRDEFSRARDWKLGTVISLRKQGGTDLIDYDAWKAMDSLEFRLGFSGFGAKMPLGWGGAQAYSTSRAVSKIGEHGDFNDWGAYDGLLARNAAMSKLTANQLTFSAKRASFPNYRDIQEFDVKNTKKNMLPFAVEVVIKRNVIATAASTMAAKTVLIGGTVIEYDPQYIDEGGVYAIAEACITFQRPFDHPRENGAVEFPSLFNPYWRASLATDDVIPMGIVAIAKRIPALSAAMKGRGSCRI